MNYVDVIILVSVLIGAVHGAFKGFVHEVASLAAFVLGIWGAVLFSDAMETYLCHRWGLNNPYIDSIAFMFTFFIIVVAVHLLGKLIDTMVKAASLDALNRALGGLFGAIRSLLLMGVVLLFIERIHEKFTIVPKQHVQESRFYQPLVKGSLYVMPFLSDFYHKVVQKEDATEEV
jgi:membrane protein required for colicin V production